MLTWALLVATIILRWFPNTTVGQWLNSYLVIIPLRLLAKADRKHIIFLLVIVVAMQAFAAVGAMDMVFAAAWDVSVYLDMMMVAGVVATVARAKSVWGHATTAYQRITQRPIRRAARAKRVQMPTRPPTKSAENDDDEWVGSACAA